MSPLKLYPYEGEMLSARQIGMRVGVTPKTVICRIARARDGQTAEEAVKNPENPQEARPTHGGGYLWKGKRYTAEALAEASGVSKSTILWRLRCGASVEEAVEKPVRRVTYDYHGEQITMKRAAEIAGICANSLRARMVKYGCTLEEAVDGKYQPGLYAYNGGMYTAEEIAEMAAVDERKLRREISSDRVSAAAAVMKLHKKAAREAAQEKLQRNAEKAQTTDVQGIAKCIMAQVIADPRMKPVENGWIHRAEACTYAVTSAEDGKMELAAYCNKTKRRVMHRAYLIDDGHISEVRA